VEFKDRLKRLRLNAGLSQSQLAKKARVPLDDVQNWEQGRRTARLEGLIKLARGLGVTLDELIVGRAPRRGRR
jgi:transcriptional regulator with XRE-family HTH domain